jgi:hypothetical protein
MPRGGHRWDTWLDVVNVAILLFVTLMSLYMREIMGDTRWLWPAVIGVLGLGLRALPWPRERRPK